MRFPDCTCVAILVAAGLSASSRAAAQQPQPPALQNASSYTIFVRGASVGSEQIAVSRTSSGWTVLSVARLNAPLDIVTRRLELRYDADWKAVELSLDAAVRGQDQTLHTAVSGNTLTTVVSIGGQTTTVPVNGAVDVLLPDPFFSPFSAVSARLRSAAPGTVIRALIPPRTPASIRVGASTDERFQTARETIDARRTHITTTPEAAGAVPIEADVWSDPSGRLLRISIPAQGLEFARDDLAAASARQVPVSRPNDEQVKIPSLGFSLAGTISKPANAATRLPAVVLLAGSGPTDRDELLYGIPVLGQLAGSLADAGFLTLRFDKRGVGQSGGRFESSTLADYADDARSAIKLLANREDVDPKRIAVIGHREGGAAALIAAAKDKRVAAVGVIASGGIAGAELVLEQQRHLLDKLQLPEADKQSRIDLQKGINQAVITGRGWDRFTPAVRRQVDTAEYQSILTFDPAKVMRDVRQPLLIVHGELDREVAPDNADRLAQLARDRKNSPPVQLAKVPGVNHLLATATTGEPDEYATLADRRVNPAVSTAIARWLQSILK